MIKIVSNKLARSLLEEELIIFTEETSKLEEFLNNIITDDLRVEDRLNEEVKNIMDSYSKEIDRGNVDYREIFTMIKRKLVRERDLVL
jgi:hypothetical protein